MSKYILLSLAAFFVYGCAFKSAESCGAEGEGNPCTPIGVNLEKAIQQSTDRKTGIDVTVYSSETNKADYNNIDKTLIRDEYSRITPKSDTLKSLPGVETRIRIYPYSDGDTFYDTRDIYVIVQRPGFARGSTVYTDKGAISLMKPIRTIPEKMTVNVEMLNVRIGPSVLFDSIATLERRTKVYPSKYRDGWYFITTTNKRQEITGWVHGDSLR